MDQAIFHWFNAWNGQSPALNTVLDAFKRDILKTVPFMVVFWALWFWPKSPDDRTYMRERLAAALACTLPIMAITRALANYMPYTPRPINTPGLQINLYDGQYLAKLDGWSSMPSDHASLFMAFAVAIFAIHRLAGAVLILWAVFVVSLPRIIWGLHWPSDILVGWVLGGGLALILLGPVTRALRAIGFVRFFERREALGYPLLFAATFEFARMFEASRTLLETLGA